MDAETRRDGQATTAMRDALVAWAAEDSARSLHPADREAVRTTEAARALVLHLFTGAHARDLFSACARLGALLAEAGASPTLAAGGIDGAVHALELTGTPFDPSRVAPARASLVEGFVSAVRDLERRGGLRSWEYPACAVALEDSAAAVACGHPSDDDEACAAWAERVATGLLEDGVREGVLAGPDKARAEVASAVELVGIRVRGAGATSHAGRAPTRSWLRWPFRR